MVGECPLLQQQLQILLQLPSLQLIHKSIPSLNCNAVFGLSHALLTLVKLLAMVLLSVWIEKSLFFPLFVTILVAFFFLLQMIFFFCCYSCAKLFLFFVLHSRFFFSIEPHFQQKQKGKNKEIKGRNHQEKEAGKGRRDKLQRLVGHSWSSTRQKKKSHIVPLHNTSLTNKMSSENTNPK